MKRKLFRILMSLVLVMGLGPNLALASQGGALRVYGDNRYATNKEVVESLVDEADLVIMVSGEVFPDALTAFNLSVAYKAPLVLTENNSTNNYSQALLDKLGVKKIIVVGGERTLSASQYNSLAQRYSMERIAGQDRYETSARVAERLTDSQGTIYVSGQAYQSALTVARLAQEKNLTIVLKDGMADNEVLVEKNGGEGKYYSGTSPAHLNQMVLEDTEAEGLVVASVNSYPDALSSVNYASLSDKKILLTDQVTRQLKDMNLALRVVGGPNTIYIDGEGPDLVIEPIEDPDKSQEPQPIEENLGQRDQPDLIDPGQKEIQVDLKEEIQVKGKFSWDERPGKVIPVSLTIEDEEGQRYYFPDGQMAMSLV